LRRHSVNRRRVKRAIPTRDSLQHLRTWQCELPWLKGAQDRDGAYTIFVLVGPPAGELCARLSTIHGPDNFSLTPARRSRNLRALLGADELVATHMQTVAAAIDVLANTRSWTLHPRDGPLHTSPERFIHTRYR
jgi:hypothetical protein